VVVAEAEQRRLALDRARRPREQLALGGVGPALGEVGELVARPLTGEGAERDG